MNNDLYQDKEVLRSLEVYRKNSKLNPKEKRWIARAKRLFKDQPKSLYIIDIDTSLTVCKEGVFAEDFSPHIGYIEEATNSLTDVTEELIKEY